MGAVLGMLFPILILAVPFIAYLVNAYVVQKERRGIAAGIPKPKEAKEPRRKKSRDARVRNRRSAYCGRDFTHFALALVGSQGSCRYCTYLEEVPLPEPPDPASRDDDLDAAVRAAEEIIDRANH
jgi:hypothetical protein